MKTSLKDWPKVYQRICRMRGLTEDEKILFARGLAATPEERWEMNVNCIKSLGFAGPPRSSQDLERRKAELRRLESPSLWQLRRSNNEVTRGRMFGFAKRK